MTPYVCTCRWRLASRKRAWVSFKSKRDRAAKCTHSTSIIKSFNLHPTTWKENIIIVHRCGDLRNMCSIMALLSSQPSCTVKTQMFRSDQWTALMCQMQKETEHIQKIFVSQTSKKNELQHLRTMSAVYSVVFVYFVFYLFIKSNQQWLQIW